LENDPKIVVDEWTAYEMNLNRRFYGLPVDRGRWPTPRDFVSLWYARRYVVGRLRDIFGDGRKTTDGGDLYDNLYFEDAAYSDIFVTGDDTLARRGRSLRLSSPRILLTEEWIAEALGLSCVRSRVKKLSSRTRSDAMRSRSRSLGSWRRPQPGTLRL